VSGDGGGSLGRGPAVGAGPGSGWRSEAGGGVLLLGVSLNCLGVGMTESTANRLQGHPGVDQFGGVDMPQLVDCGGNLRFRPVVGPQRSGGGIP
jgi:hypothetical protein